MTPPQRFEKLGVKVVLSAARFRDAKTVETEEGVFSAKRFVIATGSRPAVPAIPGLETVPYFTNETIFENTVLPKHLIIIGGGAIGVELAQAYRRLGSAGYGHRSLRALGKDDPELTAIVLESLRGDGVKILAQTAIKKISKSKAGIVIETAGHGKITGSHLLVATGRAANVEGLESGSGRRCLYSQGRDRRQGPQIIAETYLCDWRCGGRIAVYPCGQLSRGARHPERPVPAAGHETAPTSFRM